MQKGKLHTFNRFKPANLKPYHVQHFDKHAKIKFGMLSMTSNIFKVDCFRSKKFKNKKLKN